MKILKEDVYSPNDVFVDTETGKRYKYQNGKFVEIKQPKNSKGKNKKDKDKSDKSNQNNNQDANNGQGSNNQSDSADSGNPGDSDDDIGKNERSKSNDKKPKGPQIGDRPSDDDEITKAEREEREREAAEDGESESEEEREQRLGELDKLLNDTDTEDKIKDETEKQVYKSRQRKSDLERKKQLADYKAADNLSGFPRSLDNFIKNEVAAQTNRTYKKMNKTYNANTGSIIRQGKMKRKDGHIPSINVYYDQSGSWDESDIKLGNQAISVLKKYVDKGLITVDIYYFANSVGDTPNGIGGGTAGTPVMEHIAETRPDNVIVMTDSDTDYEDMPKYTVPGGVWFLWKNGESSNGFRKALRGKKSTKEFNIRQKD